MENKKILFIDLGKEYGGAEKMIENLAESISDDLAVYLYINEKNNDKFNINEDKCKVFEVITDNSKYLEVIKQIIKLVKKEKVEIVNTHGMLANVIGIILKIVCKIKLITTIHSDLNYDFYGFKRRIYYIIEKITVRYADDTITVSNNLNNKIYERHNVKAKTIYNGVKEETKTISLEKSKNNKFRLLYVGRLTKVKNLELLLNGLKYLKIKEIEFSCDIIGEGDELERLVEISKEYQINENVNFLGFRDDVKNYMRNSDMLIMTSHMEGMPMVIIEAFSNKLPVLASRVGGIPEMINDDYNGVLFNKDDKESFESAILKVVNLSENKLELLSENAYSSYKNKWSINIMKDQYLEIFK